MPWQVLGADGLLYQSIDDLVDVGRELNPAIHSFDTSCFTGIPLFAVSTADGTRTGVQYSVTQMPASPRKNCACLAVLAAACLQGPGHASAERVHGTAGQYVTKTVDAAYLEQLEGSKRQVERKRPGSKSLSMTGTL